MKRNRLWLIAALVVAAACAIPLVYQGMQRAIHNGPPHSPDWWIDRAPLVYQGAARTCRFVISSRPPRATPLPAVVLLHGDEYDASRILDIWRDYALQQRFILVVPESLNRNEWLPASDGPGFLQACVDAVAQRHPIDRTRVYLFGDGAGGGFALSVALEDSTFYAAAAVHSAALGPSMDPLLDRAPRKIPIALWTGDRDPLLPVAAAQSEQNAFALRGFPFQLHVVSYAAGGYEGVATEIDPAIWQFLRGYSLPASGAP